MLNRIKRKVATMTCSIYIIRHKKVDWERGSEIFFALISRCRSYNSVDQPHTCALTMIQWAFHPAFDLNNLSHKASYERFFMLLAEHSTLQRRTSKNNCSFTCAGITCFMQKGYAIHICSPFSTSHHIKRFTYLAKRQTHWNRLRN